MGQKQLVLSISVQKRNIIKIIRPSDKIGTSRCGNKYSAFWEKLLFHIVLFVKSMIKSVYKGSASPDGISWRSLQGQTIKFILMSIVDIK